MPAMTDPHLQIAWEPALEGHPTHLAARTNRMPGAPQIRFPLGETFGLCPLHQGCLRRISGCSCWAQASRFGGSARNSCCGIQAVATDVGLGLVTGRHPSECPFASADPPTDGVVVPLACGPGWASPGWSHLAIAAAGPYPCGLLAHGPAGNRNRCGDPGCWSSGFCGHCGGRRCGEPSCLADGLSGATPSLPWILKTGARVLAGGSLTGLSAPQSMEPTDGER